MTITPGPWKLKFEPIGNPVDHADFPHAHFLAGEDDYWDDATNTGFHLSGIMNEDDARCMVAAPEMLAALKAQHEAIDILMAMLIPLDEKFMPTKSRIWPMLLQGKAAIDKAEGKS